MRPHCRPVGLGDHGVPERAPVARRDRKSIERLPERGGFILAPTHPTGIADGIAVFDALKGVRRDIAIFANRDALRAAPGLRDLIIPVEWRETEKSHAKSRDTLEGTARAFRDERAVVLFPAGRIAFWNEGRLTERPWQNSVVALTRRYDVPIVPAHIQARNSGLFYLLSKYSTELRDITLFHELLNKKGNRFSITVGRPIPAAALSGDAVEATARLQHHTVTALARDFDADFQASRRLRIGGWAVAPSCACGTAGVKGEERRIQVSLKLV